MTVSSKPAPLDLEQSRTVHDPFFGKDVSISNRLTDRLRGKYACGPTLPNGEPEFGWRQHPQIPIQVEAADTIDTLLARLKDAEEALERLFNDFKFIEHEATDGDAYKVIEQARLARCYILEVHSNPDVLRRSHLQADSTGEKK